MPKLLLEGYVIHRRAYRETSMLVDFFTLEFGKVSAVAKGVRNTKTDKMSLLQPLQFLRIELAGRSNLKTLGALESIEKSIGLSGDMLFCAFYVNELLSRLMPEGEGFAALFNQYQLALAKLNALDKAGLDKAEGLFKVQSVLREFEFSLLETLGYLPDLSTEYVTQEHLHDEFYYDFDSEKGLVLSKIAGVGLAGSSLKNMLNKNWDKQSLIVAKRITRSALLPLLGNKPLKSRELFASVFSK